MTRRGIVIVCICICDKLNTLHKSNATSVRLGTFMYIKLLLRIMKNTRNSALMFLDTLQYSRINENLTRKSY